MKRKSRGPASLDDMSKADWIAVWKAIKRAMPQLAARVVQAAIALHEAKIPVHRRSLRAAMQLMDDGFTVHRANVERMDAFLELDHE